MPVDVAARLDAALAAEHAEDVPGALAPALASSSAISLPTPATRRWWANHRILQAAAALVLVLAGGAVVVPMLQNATGPTSMETAGSAGGGEGTGGAAKDTAELPEAAAPRQVLASGRNYRAGTFAAQAAQLVAAARGESRSGSPDRPLGASKTLDRLADPPALAQCLAGLPGGSTSPLLVDYALFEGRPAVLVVREQPDDPDQLRVYAVGPTCSARDAQILHQDTIARP